MKPDTSNSVMHRRFKNVNNELLQDGTIKICVQVHLYYLDLFEEIITNLNYIPFPFHCYISTDTDEKVKYIQNNFNLKCKNADKVCVEKFENRGRDVAPFLEQMKNVINNYEYILHIHTKKTLTDENKWLGDYWRKYLYKHLLGSTGNIYRIFNHFIKNKNLGLIFPFYPPVVPYMLWGTDIRRGKENVLDFLKKTGIVMTLGNKPEFAAGNMFWARTDAIKKAFNTDITQNDFPVENNQADMTLAHAIERSWIYIAKHEGYSYKKIRGKYYMDSNNIPAKRKLFKNKRFFFYNNNLNNSSHLFTKGLLSFKENGIKKAIEKIITYGLWQLRMLFQSIFIYNFSHECKYQENMDFSGYKPKVKTLAFFLPQFHIIPENDEWWGKGFTEWTNTRKTLPRFKWHYQPHEPHDDFGYYDLTNVETIKKQAILAKQHGIYGFCFYLYWFSGKRLLEKPLDILLEHPEIDINFCLCWANENWTRYWDGQDKKVLIRQNYLDDDPYKFINDIKKYIDDKRYIRIDGIPVILVYNPGHIVNIKDVLKKWKYQANKIGIGEIKIWICNTFDSTAKSLCIEDSIDGIVEFPPHHLLPQLRTNNVHFHNKNEETTTGIYNYKELIPVIRKELSAGKKIGNPSGIPVYRTCMMGWDNAARQKNNWTTFVKFSLKSFYEWVSMLVTDALQTSNPVFFVNAWNEWAEGTHLEPDKKYGYACINTLSKAIFGLPYK